MTFNQSKYIQQYDMENYDRILVRLPKGHKAKLKQYCKDNNISSLNVYFKNKVDQDIGNDK